MTNDLFFSVLKKGKTDEASEIKVTRGSSLLIGILAIQPDLILKEQNIKLKNPALISMTTSLFVGIVFSIFTNKEESLKKFEEEKLRTYLGIGAE